MLNVFGCCLTDGVEVSMSSRFAFVVFGGSDVVEISGG